MVCEVLLTIGLLLGQGSSAKDAPPAVLPVLQKAPDFTLVDQSGQKVRLADFKGQVVLVNFFFTTCGTTCPGATHRLAAVQREGKKRGLSPKEVQMLSITLDPEKDSPEVLGNYMRLFEVDAAGWKFLTGPANQVNKVITAWGMWVKAADKEQADHPSRLFLVDRLGRIRAIYNLDSLRLPRVMEDIGLLLKEK